jgi:hypothetical protein
LRGIRISELTDNYLFHEFGHSLAYQPNTGIGHPAFMVCPLEIKDSQVEIGLPTSSASCSHIYDVNKWDFPTYTIMSASGVLSDYSAVEKETAAWLTASEILETKEGTHLLSPIEQKGKSPKALKIPIAGADYVVYVSFRQPRGYSYPATEGDKPNGVVLEAKSVISHNFLVTSVVDKNAPLEIGKTYRLGSNGPSIVVNGINDNTASVTVFPGY